MPIASSAQPLAAESASTAGGESTLDHPFPDTFVAVRRVAGSQDTCCLRDIGGLGDQCAITRLGKTVDRGKLRS